MWIKLSSCDETLCAAARAACPAVGALPQHNAEKCWCASSKRVENAGGVYVLEVGGCHAALPFCLDFSENEISPKPPKYSTAPRRNADGTLVFLPQLAENRASCKLQAAVICLVCFDLPKKNIAHAKQHTTTLIPCVCVHLDCKTQKKERAIKNVIVRREGMSIEYKRQNKWT